MVAASPKQEAEAKRVINTNKAKVAEATRKEVEGKKIKEIKRQVEERRKKEEKGLNEAEKLAMQVQAVKEAQKQAAKACKEDVDFLIRVDRDNLSAEDLIK